MFDLDSPATEAGSTEKPYLFVSYARKDRDVVYPEVARLQRLGYRLWCDRRDIRTTRKWLDEIRDAIQDCDGFLIFLSEASDGSKYVRHEVKEALKSSRVILPIYLEKLEPSAKLMGKIGQIQGLPFYSLRTSEYEENLFATLYDLVGAPRPPAGSDQGTVREPELVYLPPRPGMTSSLPKVVCFSLLVASGFFGLFGVLAFAIPFFLVLDPNDPLSNRLGGILVGLLFSMIATGLAAGSFAVYWLHLRRVDA